MGSAIRGTGRESENSPLTVSTNSPEYLKKPSSPKLMVSEAISAARRSPGRASQHSIRRPMV